MQEIQARHFTREIRDYLDAMNFEECCWAMGEPDHVWTQYMEPTGKWHPSSGTPVLADEEPAVMGAIGRCASFRQRGKVPVDVLDGLFMSKHPGRCPWCEQDLQDLLDACDWFIWWQKDIIGEVATWRGGDGRKYQRDTGRRGVQNPVVRRFLALPQEEQRRRIDAVQGVS